MKTITIDLETRSDTDLVKSGVYAYADSPYFDILLFAYSVDDSPVRVVDLANGEKIPTGILNVLTYENVIKQAHNCNFERVCLSEYLRKNYPKIFQSYSISEDTVGNYLDPTGWHCTMIHCRYLGLPSSLADAGAVLKIEQQKMTEGKALIKFFCVTYAFEDGRPLFHEPADYPEKWELFKTYNKRDVEAEIEIENRLAKFHVPDFLWHEFYLEQEINDRGVLVDMELVDAALTLDGQARSKPTAQMRELTDIENPASVQQMKKWLCDNGLEVDSLGKKEVNELLKTAPPKLAKVLKLRQQLAKSSVKKYQAMNNAVCSDNRARGMFSFYGASRTGREAGMIIQLQNLPQNHIPDLTQARETVKYGYFDEVECCMMMFPTRCRSLSARLLSLVRGTSLSWRTSRLLRRK